MQQALPHLSACLAQIHKPTGPLAELLTPRERQIALLVARGMTNATIAREILVFPNTVKAALKEIFAKLEVSNRAALAARMCTGSTGQK